MDFTSSLCANCAHNTLKWVFWRLRVDTCDLGAWEAEVGGSDTRFSSQSYLVCSWLKTEDWLFSQGIRKEGNNLCRGEYCLREPGPITSAIREHADGDTRTLAPQQRQVTRAKGEHSTAAWEQQQKLTWTFSQVLKQRHRATRIQHTKK